MEFAIFSAPPKTANGQKRNSPKLDSAHYFAPPRIERLIVRLKNKPKSYSRSAVPTLVAVWLFRPVIGISVKLSGKRAESSLHQLTREKIRDDLTPMPV
jgi:hypothetical protein